VGILQEADEVVEIGYLNALFVVARSIGLIGHALDQKRLQQPLYRHPWWVGEGGACTVLYDCRNNSGCNLAVQTCLAFLVHVVVKTTPHHIQRLAGCLVMMHRGSG
jgi:hypothetical protein